MNTTARYLIDGGRFSLSNPEKEDFRNRVIRTGRNSKPDVRIIRVEGGGSKN